MARVTVKTAPAKTIADVACLTTAHEGAVNFPTASTVLHDAHIAARPAVRTSASAARILRERFSADDALITFIESNQWQEFKTQKILDSLRARGHACGMARLNKLLNRDAKGNPLPAAELAKTE